MRSNCLAEGFRRWWQHGGEFTMQPSKYGPFAHFKHTAVTGYQSEFRPTKKKRHRVLPPIVFTGEWTDRVTSPPRHSLAARARRSMLSKILWLLWFPVLVACLATIILYVGMTEQLKDLRK